MWTLQRLSAHLEQLPSHIGPNPSSGVYHGHMVDSPRQHGDPTTTASISRILMLAEALFQVSIFYFLLRAFLPGWMHNNNTYDFEYFRL